mgnify:CR=1 FL=1
MLDCQVMIPIVIFCSTSFQAWEVQTSKWWLREDLVRF